MPPLPVRTKDAGHRLDSGPEYRIGRDDDADIVLTGKRVSGRHAVLLALGLAYTPAAWWKLSCLRPGRRR